MIELNIKQNYKLVIRNNKNNTRKEFNFELQSDLLSIVRLFTLKDGNKLNKDFSIFIEYRNEVNFVKVNYFETKEAVMTIDLADLIENEVENDIKECDTYDFSGLVVNDSYSNWEEVDYSYDVEHNKEFSTFNKMVEWRDEIDVNEDDRNFFDFEYGVEYYTTCNEEVEFEYLEQIKNFINEAPNTRFLKDWILEN